MRKVYLDIMVDGRFYKQIPFRCSYLRAPSEDEVREYCIKTLPSLAKKKFSVVPTDEWYVG